MLFAILGAALSLGAQEFMALEPSEAGPDFPVQGEYLGQAALPGGGSEALAVQVVAYGDGEFRAVFYPGGFPGAGWTGAGRAQVAGRRAGSLTTFPEGEYTGTLGGDSLQGESAAGARFRLARVNRLSPTLNLAPPAQATVLFDGGSLAAWDTGSVDARGLLSPVYPLSGTRKSFASFSLHLEFRPPFMPFARSQNRGNSGVKFLAPGIQVTEVQIMDSFGNLPSGEECGALEPDYPPDFNASLPPLTWQTYDMHVTAPVFADTGKVRDGLITVWHNGILVQSARPLTAMPREMTLALQQHNQGVYFRNLWIVEGDDRFPFFPGTTLRPRPRRGVRVLAGNRQYRLDGRRW